MTDFTAKTQVNHKLKVDVFTMILKGFLLAKRNYELSITRQKACLDYIYYTSIYLAQSFDLVDQLVFINPCFECDAVGSVALHI